MVRFKDLTKVGLVLALCFAGVGNARGYKEGAVMEYLGSTKEDIEAEKEREKEREIEEKVKKLDPKYHKDEVFDDMLSLSETDSCINTRDNCAFKKATCDRKIQNCRNEIGLCLKDVFDTCCYNSGNSLTHSERNRCATHEYKKLLETAWDINHPEDKN